MTTIVDIRWERIYLIFELEGSIEADTRFCIRSQETGQQFPVVCKENCIKLNITNVTGIKNQEMLGAGCWELLQNKDGCDESMPLSAEVAGCLESCSRVFPYGKHNYAYAVSMETKEIEDQTICLIYSMYLKKNGNPRREYLLLEADSSKELLTEAATKIVVAMIRCFYFFASICRKNDHKHVLMMSETKKRLSGNLLSLDNWMKQNRPQYIVNYSFHETLNMQKVKVVPYWISLAWTMAKQDVILVDDYAPMFKALNLHKKTTLIQVWHAGVGFKSVGYSRFGKEDSPRPLRSAHRKYDYAIVGSTNLIPVYAEVFGIPESKVLPLGLPKIDDFLDPSNQSTCQKALTEKYSALKGKTMILFAPTYRGAGQMDAHYPMKQLDLQRIYDMCGSNRVFAIKMHPFIHDLTVIPAIYADRIIDVSQENIDELLHVADVLVSDYSSVIYEYALLDKPMLFFAFDQQEYQANRGFHWNYDTHVPGKICHTFDALITSLEIEDYERERIAKFRDFGFDNYDRLACQRICKFMDIFLDNHTK